MAQCQGPPRSDGKIFFFGLIHVWQEDVVIIPKVPGAQRDVNPAREYNG